VTHQRAACDAASVHFGPTIRKTEILVYLLASALGVLDDDVLYKSTYLLTYLHESAKQGLAFELQRFAVCVVDDDVVGDVGVQRHLVVLGRRVDAHAAAGVVRHEVVGDGQHARVLDEDVDHRRRRDVQRADAAPLDAVRLERDARVVVADVAEHESAALVARHRHVRDPQLLTRTCIDMASA